MSLDLELDNEMLLEPCSNAEQLDAWIHAYARLHIPREPVCPHHVAPFEYIHRAYFEPARRDRKLGAQVILLRLYLRSG